MLAIMFQDFADIIFNTSEGAFFFVLFLSFSIALGSALLSKKLIDTSELERKQKQIKTHEEEKVKIIELAQVDPGRYRKARKRWERKDAVVKKTQQKMGLQRMKPTCITMLPIMIIFFAIAPAFGGTPVAKASMNPYYVPLLGSMITNNRIAPWITYQAWYMICSMSFQPLFQRAFKIQTQTTGGGFSQMFSSQKAKSIEFPDI